MTTCEDLVAAARSLSKNQDALRKLVAGGPCTGIANFLPLEKAGLLRRGQTSGYFLSGAATYLDEAAVLKILWDLIEHGRVGNEHVDQSAWVLSAISRQLCAHIGPTDSNTRRLTQLLQKVQRSVPLNSLAAVDYGLGAPIDLRRGGNCVLHAHVLGHLVSSAFPDASVSCILADDGLHFAVRAVLDDAVYLLDTTALVPDRALVVPPLGDGPSAAKAYESAGRVPTALVLLHRCAAENVVMSGFYAGVGKVRERHYRFDLSAPPTDPRPYLRDGDYVRAVVKADGLLVNRVYSEEFGFLSWYKPLQKGARLVAPTDPRTRETVALEKDDSAFCAFLRAANLGCEDLDAQAIRAVDWINENCGRARIPPIRQTWGQGS